MSRRKTLETKYKVHHKELQSASDELYAIYRDANLAARKSKSRPSRFNKRVPVLEMELSNLDMDTKKKGIIEKKVEASKKDL